MSSNISTPVTSHVDFDRVYEPAEDSFLLLDALEMELAHIQAVVRPTLCLEIGPGSGVVSAGLASALGPSALYLCCDINSDACSATRQTFAKNPTAATVVYSQSPMDVIQTDVTQGLQTFLSRKKVDLIICNPPYVATPESEYTDSLSERGVTAAWAGGARGRSLTDQLIGLLPGLLSPSGAAYIILEQCNGFEAVAELAATKGLVHETIIKRRAGRELLSVVRLTKS